MLVCLRAGFRESESRSRRAVFFSLSLFMAFQLDTARAGRVQMLDVGLNRRAAAGVRPAFRAPDLPVQSSCPRRRRNFEALCAGPARFGILYEFIRSVLAAANDHTGLYGFGMKSKN